MTTLHQLMHLGFLVLIKSMSRLVSSQISGHKEGMYICWRYINPFTTKDRLEEHLLSANLMKLCISRCLKQVQLLN